MSGNYLEKYDRHRPIGAEQMVAANVSRHYRLIVLRLQHRSINTRGRTAALSLSRSGNATKINDP